MGRLPLLLEGDAFSPPRAMVIVVSGLGPAKGFSAVEAEPEGRRLTRPTWGLEGGAQGPEAVSAPALLRTAAPGT